MEIVSVKFQEDILKKIDESIKQNNFNSRTEFIREAVRDKLNEVERNMLVNRFIALRGKGKPKDNKTDSQIREEASRELLAELKEKFK